MVSKHKTAVIIAPARLSGEIKIQPSKSFAHRALICAALAKGVSHIDNIHLSQDIIATTKSLTAMGIATFDTSVKGKITVNGGIYSGVNGIIDCGESGSTLRFLIPLALLSGVEHTFTGSAKLLSRPLSPYEEICKKIGATWEHKGDKLTVKGKLTAGDYSLVGDISSQFITGLLYALSTLKENSNIRLTTSLESGAYVDLTVSAMKAFGVNIDWSSAETVSIININGGQKYTTREYTVEADYSHAAFHLVAGAIGGGTFCTDIPEFSQQPDSAIIDVLKLAGADVKYYKNGDKYGIKVNPKELKPFTWDISQCPDIAPILSILACACNGTSRLTNGARLRYKECDRLHAMAVEIVNLGGATEEGDDYLVIHGSGKLKGGNCSSHGDHRIAMSVAIASAICTGGISLDDASVVAKSAPEFWDEFKSLGGEYNVSNLGK